ncbi:hypothetical protein OY671_009872, partial [Metschnikowia pulcherrima]
PEGVRVVAVRPGVTDTGIHATGGEPDRATRLGPSLPMGRATRAEEVAEAIVWLLSDKASYTAGAISDVTGGRRTTLVAASSIFLAHDVAQVDPGQRQAAPATREPRQEQVPGIVLAQGSTTGLQVVGLHAVFGAQHHVIAQHHAQAAFQSQRVLVVAGAAKAEQPESIGPCQARGT